MNSTDFILFITKKAFWFILLIVILFIVYTLWPKRKAEVVVENSTTVPANESKVDRTVRGFGIMKDKIANSDAVKRIIEANDNPDAYGLASDGGDYKLVGDNTYQWEMDTNKKLDF